ncbi:MAG: hypothetical protein WCT04_08640 [Planctomycetota bacterium]
MSQKRGTLKNAGQPFGFDDLIQRMQIRVVAGCVVSLLLCTAMTVHAGTRRPDPKPAQPALSDDDLDSIHTVLTKMGDVFLKGNAKAMKGLLTESIERDSIITTLKREFQEASYVDFQIERPKADDSLSDIRHSVDATIRVKIVYRDDARPPDARRAIENTTFQNFIVQREPNGTFTIVNSTFFDNMGRRSGGMVLFVRALTALMLVCAMLGFWVWMASVAWWIRPRTTLWRVAMFLPPIGPLVFFFVAYLPEKLKKKK